MVRSMYSGVSGLRTHQTRMDTIGNNIANVNTYGFKSGRTTFRDIYYQTMSSASAPTAAAGGTNPSAVGYGTQVGSVDLMMDGSTFTMTGQTMDLAIDGDGFFQVQDASGNIYYTRAGMLNFDAAGNLVDMQGNYVLGINGDPTGRAPGSERISVVLPPVNPTPASVVQQINGLEFTISAGKPTIDGNLNFNFTTNANLSDNEVVASISTTGIVISMHPDNVYSNLATLNDAINNAITKANDDKEHAAGRFEISYTGPAADDPFLAGNMPAGGYKASDLVSVDYSVQLGSAKFTTSDRIFGGVYPTGKVGNTFGKDFVSDDPQIQNFTCAYNTTTQAFDFVLTIDGVDYKGSVDSSKSGSGKFFLQNGADDSDVIELARPGFDVIYDAWGGSAGTKGKYSVNPPDFPMTAGTDYEVAGYTYTPAADESDYINFLAAISANTAYDAAIVGTELVLTAKAVGTTTAPAVEYDGTTQTVSGTDGTAPVAGSFAPVAGADLGDGTTAPSAKASAASNALGFSSTAFALRGGTAGGAQTIADMTAIYIATNGIITGLDSQGKTVTIGRIDLATFANPAGLNQAGSSNFTESANSGIPVLGQPGQGGAGQLVGGSLELSNVDLSREFSDMITTQRGYQANSRIITVSDTMLEELINLKR